MRVASASTSWAAGAGGVRRAPRARRPPSTSAEQLDGLGGDRLTLAVGLAQQPALLEVEGDEAEVVVAHRAAVDPGLEALVGEQLEEEPGHHERVVAGRQGAEGPDEHRVEAGVGRPVLGDACRRPRAWRWRG